MFENVPNRSDIKAFQRQIKVDNLAEVDIETFLLCIAGTSLRHFRAGNGISELATSLEKPSIARPDVEQMAARLETIEEAQRDGPTFRALLFLFLPCLEGAAGVIGSGDFVLRWAWVSKDKIALRALRNVWFLQCPTNRSQPGSAQVVRIAGTVASSGNGIAVRRRCRTRRIGCGFQWRTHDREALLEAGRVGWGTSDGTHRRV